MAITREQIGFPIYTSDVTKYDGNTLYITPLLPVDASLNDVLYWLDYAINAVSISPVTTLSSNNITMSNSIVSGTINIALGSSLTSALTLVSSAVSTLETSITNYLLKSTYNANTIIKADSDDTPIALTVAASTVVGRKSTGSIVSMTMAELTTELNLVTRDATNGVIKPYTNTDHLAVGADSSADKKIVTLLESATFANNPYIEWHHNTIGTDYGILIDCKSTQAVSRQTTVNKDNYFLLTSTGTMADTFDQAIRFEDQTGIASTLRYWKLFKDGSDSRTMKFSYWNGAALKDYINIDTSGYFSLFTGVGVTAILDEDNMVSDSDTSLCTQQSIKAYVDNTLFTALLPITSDISDLQDASDYSIDGVAKNALVVVATIDYTDILTSGSYSVFGSTDIPIGAILTNVVVDVTTAFTDDVANASTIGIGVEIVGVGNEDIKNAAAVGTDYVQAVMVDAFLTGSLTFDQQTPIKITAARDITINVVLLAAATTLSTGKMKIYIHYLI